MTLQMALLEERMEGELQGEKRGRIEGEKRGRVKGTESVAIKLIRRGRPLQEIHEDTGLPIQRLEELAEEIPIRK